MLLFWASFNNIEKIQKLKDNKTVMLHWATKDKDNCYLMNLFFTKREEFLKDLLERVKTFGIVCTYKSKFGYHNLYKE